MAEAQRSNKVRKFSRVQIRPQQPGLYQVNHPQFIHTLYTPEQKFNRKTFVLHILGFVISTTEAKEWNVSVTTSWPPSWYLVQREQVDKKIGMHVYIVESQYSMSTLVFVSSHSH